MGINHIPFRFLIIATGFNCKQYIKLCFDSIVGQSYTNYDVIIVDDCSNDGTFDEIKKHAKSDWTIIRNKLNCGTILSRDKAIKQFNREFDVIVWLDLDDQLMSHSLQRLNEVYQDQNILMTYGNYVTDKGDQPFKSVAIPDEIHESNSYRKHKFMFMHLRSFKKSLYFKLSDSDIFDPNVKIYNDANMLFCLMEMSGQKRMVGIDEPLYIYNVSNPLSLMNTYHHNLRKAELEYLSNLKPKNRL